MTATRTYLIIVHVGFGDTVSLDIGGHGRLHRLPPRTRTLAVRRHLRRRVKQVALRRLPLVRIP